MKINSSNTVSLGEVLEYEQPTKYIVDNTNYDDEFDIPVLTAGKSFLLGYTNETHNVFSNVPVIIFDDFTTAFKYVDFPFKVKSSAMKILKANKEVADIRFLYYRMMKTGIDTELHKRYWISKYSKVKIPLPPLDQQKKIAAILDAADEYRQKTKTLIEKYDELLNSIVYQCLGDSLNKDLKNIKSGSKEFLEDGYSWYSLNEITELIADIDHKMPKSVEEGKIFLSAKDLSDNGELDFSNPKFISEEDFKHLSRKVKPKKLDIIYSRIGAKLGKARLVKTDHDFIVSYSCCTIRPKQDIVAPLYLKYILDSEATLRQASHGTRGIGVPDLGMGEIRTFKIPVPEKSISKKIVNQLERIEAQKAQAQASLAQAEDLFNSLLQKAFKGELTD